MKLAVAVAIVCAAATARADGASDFAALRGIDAFEAYGARRPITAWTDNAWIEAARLAERGGDLPRARRDLEAAIAAGDDPRVIERARNDLARLGSNRWDAVGATHDRLVAAITGASDPTSALEQLDALIRANPDYPRSAGARLVVARAWELEGETDRALAILDPASEEYARILVMHDRAGAAQVVAAVRDPVMRATLASELASATRRTWLHRIAWIVIALGAIAAAWVARRSWRALRRPPAEVIFVAPIALVLVLVARTGNPLVATAVTTIAPLGIAIAWIAGALPAKRRGLVAIAATIVAACVVYLAVDRGSLSSMIAETWRAGPAR